MAQPAPLMPKATAVWLVENTALSFDQIADFCKLHPLEVKAIADGDAAQGIKGLDPIQTGQLSREEIEKAEADPDYRLKLRTPRSGCRSPSARRARATRRCRAARTARTRSSGWCATIRSSRTRRSCGWSAPPSRRSSRSASAPTGTRQTLQPMDPVTLGPVLADRSRPRGASRRQGEAGRRRGAGRDAAARLRDDDPCARAGAGPRRSRARTSTSMRCSPS